ncbi:signal-regulatory protein beta-2-like [Etheostoma spectabile]|uniref:signal-regulatory protein beta-2-like n=1 Tax=Etheostoma spectabile TaxID=54343 RepID=UPI0013AED76D|nr:signal-regulatory protein beta-2-like [Etheostoma spectabile]
MGMQAEKMAVCLLNMSLLWSVCEAQLSDISQPAAFQAVELGHTVTFTCNIKSAARTRVWYTLNTGRRLQPLASTDTLYNLTIIKDKSHRYEVQSDHISSLLTILRTTWEDVGTYYCGVMDLRDIQFGQGTFLMITGANPIRDSSVQQRESGPVQPGDSVTLSCSVRTGRCAAEHISVTWLKSSHPSAPQMIYYSGNKSCQRTESGETSCVYELLLRNLSSDDAGTFYCVLTSCGQTLFGNGTRIIVHRDVAFTESVELSPTVIALMLSNTVLGIGTLVLVWTLCKNHKKYPTAALESRDGSHEASQPGDAVTYAAVCSAPRGSSRRTAPMEYSSDAVVYSHVKFSTQD